MLSVICTMCGATFYVPQEAAGQEAKCGTCGRMVAVPKVEAGGQHEVLAEGAWEYLIVADRGRLGRVDQVKLNELGGQGWELVSVFRESAEAHTMFYFKRPRGTGSGTGH